MRRTKAQKRQNAAVHLPDYARDKPCQIRIPEACNYDPATSVWCHWNGGGMGLKHPDLLGAIGCSDCHLAVDRKGFTSLAPEYVRLCHADGVFRTQLMLIKDGIVVW